LVRVGTLLYGQYPGAVPAAQQTLDLRPALELRSTIVGLANLDPGDTVGYGAELRCTRKTRAALLPVGYAAGLGTLPESLARRRWGGLRGWARGRLHRGEGETATLAGQPAAFLGRIAMDWCCVDVTELPDATVGTEVTLPARRLMLDSSLPRLESAPRE
jgi:alanine racemase